MPILPMPMTVSQIHPDVINYIRRVATDGGTIRPPIVSALNEFVKYCYRYGFRSNTGTGHVITMCVVFCTNALAGYKRMLWYPSTLTGTMNSSGDGTFTYAETTGLAVKGNAGWVDTLMPGTALNAQNCCMFYHSLSNVGNKDYFGSSDVAVGSGTGRFLINPRWLDDNNLYFDIMDSSTNRISAANSTSAGLTIGMKNGATQSVYKSGSLLVQSTTKPTTGVTMPGDTFTCTYNGSADNATIVTRNVAGFGAGTAFNTGAIAGFTTAWNTLQAAMGR